MNTDLRNLPRSRAAAMLGNSKFFVSGPCLRGHVAARYTSSGKCVACQSDPKIRVKERARKRAWNNRNPVSNAQGKKRSQRLQLARRYIAKVKTPSAFMAEDSYRRLVEAKALIISATLRAIERDIYNGKLATEAARLDRWQDQRTQWKSNNHKRKSYLQDAGKYTRRQVRLLLDAQGHECAYCNARSKLTIDHMTPLARGGSNRASNLQWLCLSHNSSKCDKTDSEYRAIYGDTLKPVNTLAGYYRLLFLIMEGKPHAKTKERKPACTGVAAIPGSERARTEILSRAAMPQRPPRRTVRVESDLLPLQHGSIKSPQRGENVRKETVQRHSRVGVRDMRVCENKAAARAEGRKTYDAPYQCETCSTTRRYTHSGNCVECARIAAKDYRKGERAQEANRERQARFRARKLAEKVAKENSLFDDI